MKSILLFSSIFLFCSCSTLQRSTLLGAIIGGTTTGITGSMIAGDQSRARGAVIGSLVGASVGGVIGYLTYKSRERTESENKSATNGSVATAPLLTSPKVRRVWVPAKIEGEKYIEGHFMFVIEKTSGWSN